MNSGSEANDLALLMARCYTNNYETASLLNCYHGMTQQTMGITANGYYKYPVPQPACLHVIFTKTNRFFMLTEKNLIF